MIKLNGVEVVPTIFPDGTSQVWKVDMAHLKDCDIVIDWYWEGNEAELFQLSQLIEMMSRYLGGVNAEREIHVNIPYFPYARQDKDISNELTFAKRIYSSLLATSLYDVVNVLDIHSNSYNPRNLVNHMPWEQIAECINLDYSASVLVFPDVGAQSRYSEKLSMFPSVCFSKNRDQSSGEITSMTISHGEDVIDKVITRKPTNNLSFLIIDDICDGGKTFIDVAKELKTLYPSCNIGLFTTHGIYSKGVDNLLNNGIDKVYTTNSLKYLWAKKGLDTSKLNVYDIGNQFEKEKK